MGEAPNLHQWGCWPFGTGNSRRAISAPSILPALPLNSSASCSLIRLDLTGRTATPDLMNSRLIYELQPIQGAVDYGTMSAEPNTKSGVGMARGGSSNGRGNSARPIERRLHTHCKRPDPSGVMDVMCLFMPGGAPTSGGRPSEFGRVATSDAPFTITLQV